MKGEGSLDACEYRSYRIASHAASLEEHRAGSAQKAGYQSSDPHQIATPHPGGFYGDETRECRCTPGIIQRYLAKVSGPLLDRIDLHIEVPAVPYKELRTKTDGQTSAQIRERVEQARDKQRQRGFYNSQIPPPSYASIRARRERRADTGNGSAPNESLSPRP